jgi:hypothetical protein
MAHSSLSDGRLQQVPPLTTVDLAHLRTASEAGSLTIGGSLRKSGMLNVGISAVRYERK